MTQTFTVPGLPIAKARPRAGHMNNGRIRIYTPQKTLNYERDVAWEAKHAKIRRAEGIVAVTLRFFGCKGDADNLAKSVLDGLNGIAYNDDRQIEELHIYVDRVGKPARTEVEIRTKGDPA